MRKVIDGKTYNTTTSKLVGQWDNGHFTSDFKYCSEDLYRNTKGAYFLHGEGGALSKYAVLHGNNTGGSEQIIPMTIEEARTWAEEHLETDEYEAEFGPQEEVEPSDLATRERVTLVIDNSIIARLREYSAKSGIPMSRMADEALGRYLENK